MVDRGVFKYPDTAAYDFVVKRLGEHGVTVRDIAGVAYDSKVAFNKKHHIDEVVDINYIEKITIGVLHKREVLNNAMVGLELDRLATEGELAQPLQDIVENDLGVFGVDETLALSIAAIYGTIGITDYGDIDIHKPGIIGKLDRETGTVNTFIDDLVGAVAGAVIAKLAHDDA